jgi:hypothetical protein
MLHHIDLVFSYTSLFARAIHHVFPVVLPITCGHREEADLDPCFRAFERERAGNGPHCERVMHLDKPQNKDIYKPERRSLAATAKPTGGEERRGPVLLCAQCELGLKVKVEVQPKELKDWKFYKRMAGSRPSMKAHYTQYENGS